MMLARNGHASPPGRRSALRVKRKSTSGSWISESTRMRHRRSDFSLPKRPPNRYDAAPRTSGGDMKRREFIVGLTGAAATSFASSAQERVRRPRVGFLMHLAPGDPDAMARVAGFLQGLQELAGQRTAIFKSIIDGPLVRTNFIANTRQSWSHFSLMFWSPQ